MAPSPIPAELLKQAMTIFPCGFQQVYGLTETTGAITVLPAADHDPNDARKLLSCGYAQKGVELRIVGDDGKDLPAGQVGEIAVRSPQVMGGYWKLPEATARAVQGDWFFTGDAGYLDDKGYLYIYDRVKDMIVSGGENIYPAEVESALFGHPAGRRRRRDRRARRALGRGGQGGGGEEARRRRSRRPS